MIPAGGYLKQLCFSCRSKLSLGAWTVLPSRSARGRTQHRVMFHLQDCESKFDAKTSCYVTAFLQ